MPVPEFSQYVEYVTEGEGGEPVVHFVLPHQLSLDTPLVLQALAEGYAHAASLGRTLTLEPEGVANLKAAALEVYHQDVVDNEIVGNSPAEVVANLITVRSYPEWWSGATVAAGQVWFYAGNLYRCVQGHTVVDAAWTPGVARALWVRYYESGEVPAWAQPLGAHDAWALGARVTHAGHTWRSLVAANVWEPGVAQWECEDCEPQAGEWAVGVVYKVGDIVTYQGAEYQCRQAHTSQAGWHPVAVPALWLLISPA